MYLTALLAGIVAAVFIGFLLAELDNARASRTKRTVDAVFSTIGLIWPVLILALVAGVVVSTLVSHSVPMKRAVVEHDYLTALVNGSEIEGSYFLLGGSIGEENVYKYIEVNDRGGSRLREIDAGSVVIYQDATTETAYKVRYEMQSAASPWAWFHYYEPEWDYEFHVPPQTVKSEFDVSVSN